MKLLVWVALVSSACSKACPVPKECPPDLASGRSALEALVRDAGVRDPNRRVVHLSHVCSLLVESTVYPVVDLQELVKGATTPRGVNSILIFDANGKLRRRLEYTNERPLFCAGPKLYVWGDLRVEGVLGEGNELELSEGGQRLSLRQVDVNGLAM